MSGPVQPINRVRVIPGQIILVKQVNIHVYSIEVAYLSLISIVNPLLAVPRCRFLCRAFFGIYVVFFMPSCMFLVALWPPAGRGWPLVCGVFLCFYCFPMWCPGLGVVLGRINS